MNLLSFLRAKPTPQQIAQQALAADVERRFKSFELEQFRRKRAAALKPPKETGDAK